MTLVKLRPYNRRPSPLLSVFLLMFFMLFKRQFPNLTCLLVLLIQDKYDISPYFGSKGGAVVRAFSSHQCGQGSNHELDAMCGLSLLLVLSFAPRVFSLGIDDEDPLCSCATSKTLFCLFIYLFIYLFTRPVCL